MNLIPCKKSELRKTTRTNLFRLIKEFTNSGAECAQVAGGAEHYASANVGVRAINAAIKHYKFVDVKAISNDGQIYLVRDL